MITQALCSSFKAELAKGIHDFTASTGDTFKIALYVSGATMNANTTTYSTSFEIAGTGYTLGGAALTSTTPYLSGATAIIDFADVTWTDATFTARGAMIYNSTKANRAVMILDFGSDRTVSSGTFTITFPAPDASSAILRIS